MYYFTVSKSVEAHVSSKSLQNQLGQVAITMRLQVYIWIIFLSLKFLNNLKPNCPFIKALK